MSDAVSRETSPRDGRDAAAPVGVSRETSPPAAATEVFGARLDLARDYVNRLTGPGIERGLLGPREAPRVWGRHVLNCAVLTELIPEGAAVADVGSGAGLPGLVLAIRRPDLHVTLIEPLQRRVDFLDETVAELGLSTVTVRRDRAEQLHGQARFDVVTSRAVAPLAKLAGWSLPLTRPGGLMLALKGASAAEELDRDGAAVRRAGGEDARVLEIGTNLVDSPVRVVSVRARGVME